MWVKSWSLAIQLGPVHVEVEPDADIILTDDHGADYCNDGE